VDLHFPLSDRDTAAKVLDDLPLLGRVELLQVLTDLRALARQYHHDFATDRGQEPEARVLEVIRDLHAIESVLSMKAVADSFSARYGAEYERPITPRWIGQLVRRRLHLRTRRLDSNFVLTEESLALLEPLLRRYGLAPTAPVRTDVH
jgi:hypothetical protein